MKKKPAKIGGSMKVACRIVKLLGFCGNCQNPGNPCASAGTVNDEIAKDKPNEGGGK